MSALLLAALLSQAATRPQPPAARPQPPASQGRRPLSREDEELVKQLALLERVELLRNLELFEATRQDQAPDQSSPREP